jgi:hypothetical protein
MMKESEIYITRKITNNHTLIVVPLRQIKSTAGSFEYYNSLVTS